MPRKPAWRRYLRLFGADPAADFEDELQFHLETKIDELIASGYPPDQARAEALRQFGPVRAVRRECVRITRSREMRASRAEYFAGWFRDVRYAARSLRRSKASSLAAILIFAVGIGANTAVFTLLDRLLLAPLPVPHPSELVSLSESARDRRIDRLMSQDFATLRDANQTFSGIAAEAVRVRERRGRERIGRPADGLAVSGNYFEVLRVNAALGRAFSSADDSRVAVLSDRFWEARFHRSPEALGSTLYLNGSPYIVIGILPRGFFGLHRSVDCNVYVPIASLSADAAEIFSDRRWLTVFGRLRPGVSPVAAEANLRTLLGRERIEAHSISTGTPGVWGERQRSLWLLAAIVAALLIMGCVNVACLMLARGAVRRQEMAVRLWLGGKRSRVIRQSLLESVLLACAGGAAGLALALPAERLLVAAFQWQDRPIDLSPDLRVLAFGVILSLAAAILSGLAPAWQLWRSGRLALARERSLSPKLGAGRVLIVMEVALSLVLVAGATVFLRSFQNLRAVPTGFSTDRVSYLELGNPADPEGLKAPYSEGLQLAETLRRTPGIEAAAVSDMLTFDEGWIGYDVTVPGTPAAPQLVHLLRVEGDYFAALRISLRSGRTFTSADNAASPRVAILTEGAARRLFGNESPLGRSIVLGAKPEDRTEIVGVVSDIKFGSVTAPAPSVIFQPLLQVQANGATTSSLKLHVRARMAPAEVAALARSRICEMRLPMSVDRAAALADAIAHSMLEDRIRMQASGVFGFLALALMTAGVYGLVAYSVAMRTREIGIRIAVGSRPGLIVAMVLRQGLRLTLAGALLGMPAALAAMKAISRLVFGLAPIDWTSVAAATGILCITGILASIPPAWRAARLDPVDALRVQ